MAPMLKNDAGGKRDGSDRGSALVMAAIISVVVFALAGVLLSFANRESTASNHDRQRQQAIDAAMAGSVVANSALTTNASFTGSGLVAFAGGSAEFEVSVVTDTTVVGGLRRVVTSHGYAPSKALSKEMRTVRQVVDLDPVSFSYGVFAAGNFGDGSSSTVIGGIYTGGNITLGNAHDYIGDLYSRGNIVTGSNQQITGTLHANGNVIVTNTSTNVFGSVYARGNIETGGTIRDVAQAGGTIGSSGCPTIKVQGTCIQHQAPPLVQEQKLPTFVYSAANYLPLVPINMSGTAFVAEYKNKNVSGVFNLTGSADFDKNDSLRLTGDLTIVASGNIILPGTVSNNSSVGANVQLTVIAQGSATAANNLTIPATITTLVYTKGNFDAKNSSTFTGVLYAGGNISIGANSSITYAPISAPGFDWTLANPQSFTIRNISTRETTGS